MCSRHSTTERVLSIAPTFFFTAKTACLGNVVTGRTFVAVFQVISVIDDFNQLNRFACLPYPFVQLVAQRGKPLHV